MPEYLILGGLEGNMKSPLQLTASTQADYTFILGDMEPWKNTNPSFHNILASDDYLQRCLALNIYAIQGALDNPSPFLETSVSYITSESKRFFLPRYGNEVVDNIFFVGGGHFADGARKFTNQALSDDECAQALDFACLMKDLWEMEKEMIFLTYEMPAACYQRMYNDGGSVESVSSTMELLQAIYDIYQPLYWVIGGYEHTASWVAPSGTQFYTLGPRSSLLLYIDD